MNHVPLSQPHIENLDRASHLFLLPSVQKASANWSRLALKMLEFESAPILHFRRRAIDLNPTLRMTANSIDNLGHQTVHL